MHRAPEHRDGLVDRGLLHLHGLEAAIERGVLLEVALVLPHVVAATMRSSPRASAGLSRLAASPPPCGPPAPISVCASSTKSTIRLRRRLHLVEHALEAPLELALRARTGLEAPQVEREELGVAERLGHIARRDSQGQPLDDCRLAHAGLADDQRIVLSTAAEDVDHLAHLALAPEDGVEAALAGLLGQIGGELRERAGVRRRTPVRVQRGRCCGRMRGCLVASGAPLAQPGSQVVARDDLQILEWTGDVAGGRGDKSRQQCSRSNPGLSEGRAREDERVLEPLKEDGAQDRTPLASGALLLESLLDAGAKVRHLDAEALAERHEVAPALVEKRPEHVLDRELVVPAGPACARRPLEGALAEGVERLRQFFRCRDEHGHLRGSPKEPWPRG